MSPDSLDNLKSKETSPNEWEISESVKFLNLWKFNPNLLDQIKDVLGDSNFGFASWFEDFLRKADMNQKIKVKKELADCKTKENVISVISKYAWLKTEEKELWNMNNENAESMKAKEGVAGDGKKDDNEGDEDMLEGKGVVAGDGKKREKSEMNYKDLEDLKEKAKQKREELLKDQPKIAEEIEKKAAEIKNNIQVPPEIKKQLKKSGYNEDFINEYILSKVTLSEVKKNPVFEPNKVKEFEWLVWELDDWLRLNSLDVFLKNIDNACNVADTRLSSFSSNENLSQTRHELFYDSVWNEDLIALKSSNIEMRNENSDGKGDYEKMFPEMSEEDMVKTYWKFLSKSKWAQHYLDEYNERMNGPQAEKEKYMKTKNYKDFIETIKNIKTSVDNKTKDLMEELCIISQIKWMYMCMGEWDNFELNKSKEINNENWILTLKGHVDWVDFAIRHDTTKESPLETSTSLRKEWNDFLIGQSFKDSNFILPTQDMIFNVAIESVTKDWALKDASSPKDYIKLQQEKFMNRINKMYDKTKYAHDYMEEQVKWEKIVNKTVSLIRNLWDAEPWHSVTEANKNLYDFVSLMNFNLEYSTPHEKEKLDKILTNVINITSQAKESPDSPELKAYPNLITNYLIGNLSNTKNILSGGKSEWETIFDLFKIYRNTAASERSDGKSYMINFDELLNDLVPNNIASMTAQNRVEKKSQEDGWKVDNNLALKLWLKSPPLDNDTA